MIKELHVTKIIITTLLLALISGCASYNYSGRFEKTGMYDPSYTSSVNEKAEALKWEDAKDIAVFIGELPEGITDNNGTYKSLSNNIEIMGTAKAQPSNQNAMSVYFQDYAEDEDWRNTYCPIQGGLYYGTFMFWGLTPFPWVCQVMENNDSDSIEKRKHRIINTLKKMAKAAGGNAIVVTRLGSLQFVDADTNIVMNNIEMTSAEALVLNIKTPIVAQSDSI